MSMLCLQLVPAAGELFFPNSEEIRLDYLVWASGKWVRDLQKGEHLFFSPKLKGLVLGL